MLPKGILYSSKGSNSRVLRALRIKHGPKPSRRALLFYKVPNLRGSTPQHTNEIEVWDWLYALSQLGYEVDLVSRSSPSYLGEGDYDLFLGLGTSGSSRYFLEHAESARAERNILIATTPHPTSANEVRRRHLLSLQQKYGLLPGVDRIDPSEDWISQHLDVVDSLMVYGIEGSFADKSFDKCGLPRATFGPSSLVPPSPPKRTESVDPTSFVLYSGSGLLAKGADIVVESFLRNPHLSLSILGHPDAEFINFLENQTRGRQNIVYSGFYRSTRRSLTKLRNRVAGQILTSPSEGAATSVATLAGFGIVPIMSEEVGYPNWNDFSVGYVDNGIGDRLDEALSRFSRLSHDELYSYRRAEYDKARNFSREGFRAGLLRALAHLRV